MQPADLRPGVVVRVDAAASVQFAHGNAITFRIIKVSDEMRYTGWSWIAGYVLDAKGNAVERRDIYVERAGLRLVSVRRR